MGLTGKQREVLDALVHLSRAEIPPTVREVGRLVGLRSSATVQKHLKSLEAQGFIEVSGRSRGIRVVKGTGVPLVGRIAAGEPVENLESDGTLAGPESLSRYPELSVDPALFAPGSEAGDLVALRVCGDSMVEAGILNGDLVLVRRQPLVQEGEIAAVTIDGSATLKRWGRSRSARRGASSGVRLSPANERLEPIEVHEDDGRDVRVLGKYVGLIRGDFVGVRE